MKTAVIEIKDIFKKTVYVAKDHITHVYNDTIIGTDDKSQIVTVIVLVNGSKIFTEMSAARVKKLIWGGTFLGE